MLSITEKLEFCKICTNKKNDSSREIICSLTEDKPMFKDRCPDYETDEEFLNNLIGNKDLTDSASALKRFLNLIIDIVGFYILLILITFLSIFISAFTGTDISWLTNMDIGLKYLIIITIHISYYVLFEGIFTVTPGKLITRTRVITENGDHPSFKHIILRTLCRFIPFDHFSFLGDAVGWHDTLSKTRVVDRK